MPDAMEQMVALPAPHRVLQDNIQRAVHPAVRQSVRVVMVVRDQHHHVQINVRPVHIVHQQVEHHNLRVPVSVRVVMVLLVQRHHVLHRVRKGIIPPVAHRHVQHVRRGPMGQQQD